MLPNARAQRHAAQLVTSSWKHVLQWTSRRHALLVFLFFISSNSKHQGCAGLHPKHFSSVPRLTPQVISASFMAYVSPITSQATTSQSNQLYLPNRVQPLFTSSGTITLISYLDCCKLPDFPPWAHPCSSIINFPPNSQSNLFETARRKLFLYFSARTPPWFHISE